MLYYQLFLLLAISLLAGSAMFYMKSRLDGLRRTLQLLVHLFPMGWDYIVLKYRIKGFSETLQAPHWAEFHSKWAKAPLNVVLELRGFYVKVAQQMAGMPDAFIPKPYLDNLQCLIEDVPAQPFPVMLAILEDELCCEITEVFKTFEETPIGAASIGQVHRAQLMDGTDVVVKIQYPETEAYFRLDLTTIAFLFKYALHNDDAVEMLKSVEKNFEMEFDYALEGANLRRMVNEVQPHFTELSFPSPYDKGHPNLPAAMRKKGTSLVTKRVLTMDLCKGESVQRLGGRVLEQMAKAQGFTKRELEVHMQRQMLNPEDGYMENMLKLVPTQEQMDVTRAFFKGRDYLRNAHAAHYNWTLGALTGSKIEYTESALPLNGPALLKRLFDIHGFQIFQVGAFNADPHAGNMLFDEASDTLSLIDYGQLVDIAPGERKNLAKMIVAFEQGDAAGVRAGFVEMGVEVTDTRTGEVNSEEALMLLFAMHFEGIGALTRIKEYLGVSTLHAAMSEMPTALQVKGIPTYYLMVHRCVTMLSGVGTGIGFAGPNAAKLLLPSAQRYLNGSVPTTRTRTRTPTQTGISFEPRATVQQVQNTHAPSQPEAKSTDDGTLETWLQQHAGLHGKKLAVALHQCDDGMVESVADLERLHDLGQLGEVFPQIMLRELVAAALNSLAQQPQKQQRAGQPMDEKKHAPSFRADDFMHGTSKFLAQVEESRKIVEKAWAEKAEEHKKCFNVTMAKHQDDVIRSLKWAVDGIEKNCNTPDSPQNNASYM